MVKASQAGLGTLTTRKGNLMASNLSQPIKGSELLGPSEVASFSVKQLQTEEGLSFPGVAVIFGPDGRLSAHYVGERENILYAELRDEVLQDVRRHRMRYFLPERRPALYIKESPDGDQ